MSVESKYDEIRQANRKSNVSATLTLKTSVPDKYRVLDLETGQVWKAKIIGYVVSKDGSMEMLNRWVSSDDINFSEKEK
jgi:hypothetical protein